MYNKKNQINVYRLMFIVNLMIFILKEYFELSWYLSSSSFPWFNTIEFIRNASKNTF